MFKMYLTMTTIFLRKYLRNIVIVKVEIFLRQMRIPWEITIPPPPPPRTNSVQTAPTDEPGHPLFLARTNRAALRARRKLTYSCNFFATHAHKP